MQALFDLLPLIAFLVVLIVSDIFAATAALIVGVVVQLGAYWYLKKPINKMILIGAAAVFLFGGLTLLLHDKAFIQWKPTIVYWLFALAFLASRFIAKETLTEKMYRAILKQAESPVALDASSWRFQNWVLVITYAAFGAINLIVFMNFDTIVWGYSKLAMAIGLLVVIVVQLNWILSQAPRQTEP